MADNEHPATLNSDDLPPHAETLIPPRDRIETAYKEMKEKLRTQVRELRNSPDLRAAREKANNLGINLTAIANSLENDADQPTVQERSALTEEEVGFAGLTGNPKDVKVIALKDKLRGSDVYGQANIVADILNHNMLRILQAGSDTFRVDRLCKQMLAVKDPRALAKAVNAVLASQPCRIDDDKPSFDKNIILSAIAGRFSENTDKVAAFLKSLREHMGESYPLILNQSLHSPGIKQHPTKNPRFPGTPNSDSMFDIKFVIAPDKAEALLEGFELAPPVIDLRAIEKGIERRKNRQISGGDKGSPGSSARQL